MCIPLWSPACEHLAEESGEAAGLCVRTATMVESFPRRLLKLLLWLGLRCCQNAVSWESLQTERLGEKYYLRASCAMALSVCSSTDYNTVCLCGRWRVVTSSNHLWQTAVLKCNNRKEKTTPVPFIFLLLSSLLPVLPPSPERPIELISSSKWLWVFDVQTSFEPRWETKVEVCSPC